MFTDHRPSWRLNGNVLLPHNSASALPAFDPNDDIVNETDEIESITSEESITNGPPSDGPIDNASPSSAFIGGQAEFYDRFGHPDGDQFDGAGFAADIGDNPYPPTPSEGPAHAVAPLVPAHKELVSTLPLVKPPCIDDLQGMVKTYCDQGVQASPHHDRIQASLVPDMPRKQLKRSRGPDDAEKENDDGRGYLQAYHTPKAAKRRRQPEVVKVTVEMRLAEEGKT
jgi:hypothetical protein